MESKVRVGSGTGMIGATEKSRVMAGLEVETVAGTETGVDTDVGTDLKSTVDTSGNVGAVVGVGSAMVSMGVETKSMVVGMDTKDDLMGVTGAQLHTIVETILPVCVVVSEFLVLANVQLGIVRMGTEMAEQLEGFTGMGTVPSACVVVREVSAPANAQLGIVVMETETEVAAACSVGDVHPGMSLETVMVVEGASANMATLAVSEVGWMEGKTGPCAAFNVNVVGQDMNTT